MGTSASYDPPAVSEDFFRSTADNKAPDGTNDVTENVRRLGSVAIGGATQNQAIVDVTSPTAIKNANLVLSSDTANRGQMLFNTSPLSYYLERVLPAIGNHVKIGRMTQFGGAFNHRISLSVSDSSFATAKQYVMSWRYGQATTGVVVAPTSSGGAFGANDFELIAIAHNGYVEYSIRRISGTTAGLVHVRIESTTAPDEVFEEMSTVVADTTVYPVYQLEVCPRQITTNPASGTTSSTVDSTVSDIVFVGLPAASLHTLTISNVPAGINPCNILIKRTDNNIGSTLRISSGNGIDGAAANRISLGTSTAYGSNTGESVTLQWHENGTTRTWRIV